MNILYRLFERHLSTYYRIYMKFNRINIYWNRNTKTITEMCKNIGSVLSVLAHLINPQTQNTNIN